MEKLTIEDQGHHEAVTGQVIVKVCVHLVIDVGCRRHIADLGVKARIPEGDFKEECVERRLQEQPLQRCVPGFFHEFTLRWD